MNTFPHPPCPRTFRDAALRAGRALVCGVLGVLPLVGAGVASAQTFTWSGSGTTAAPGDGTWDTTSGNWDGSGAAWVNGAANNAIFGGTGTVAVNVGANISANALEFLGGNYTLNASSPETITLADTATTNINTGGAIQVGSGATANIGSNVTVDLGSGNHGGFITAATATGTMGTLNVSGAIRDTGSVDDGGVIVNILAGGSITAPQYAMGFFTSNGGVTNVEGGTLTASTSLTVDSGNANTTQLTVGKNDMGGTVNTGSLILNTATNANTKIGQVVLYSTGTIITGNVTVGISTGIPANSAGLQDNFYFDGGTLQASKDNADFMSVSNAYVGAGTGGSEGGVIDNGGHAITIGQALVSGAGVAGSNVAAGATDGGLIFQGAGTTTLSGANTYTGATVVRQGTVLVTGSLGSASAVQVAANSGSSATLGGTGTIGGAVTVGNGTGAGLSILTVGGTDATGTIMLGGGVTFGTKSELSFQFDSGTGAFDRFTITGALDLAGLATLSGTDLGNTTLALGRTFILASATGGIDGTFQGIAEGQDITIGGNTFQVNYGDLAGFANDLTLTTVAAPEPATWAMMIGGLAALVAFQRRRGNA